MNLNKIGIAPRKSSKGFTAVGLDIGSYSIKCVEVTRLDGKPRLDRVMILPVDTSQPAKLSAALRVLQDPFLTPAKPVRISVSGGSSLIIRRISLPSMTASELKGAIRFEAESHIPFSIDECQLDFHILGQKPDRTMDVLLVAAKKDFIQQRLKLLGELNVVPEIIDVDIFCLINAFEMLGESQAEQAYGVLNVGHRMSSFAIMAGGTPFFVREIPAGAVSVTKELASIRQIPEAEADALKIEQPKEALADLELATARGFQPLINEIRHSVDYYENDQDELRTIYLSGGGSLSAGASRILSEELGKKVLVWDNTKKLDIFGELDRAYLVAHAQELNVALGMVLQTGGRKK